MVKHKATLQRLDVFHPNNGVRVFYDPAMFGNAEQWNGKPVIMPLHATPSRTIKHPDHDSVTNGTLDPLEYKVVGYLSDVHLSKSGEPRLMGDVDFVDDEAEKMAMDGKLSPSTGFDAKIAMKNTDEGVIASEVVANHLLVFPRGFCKNCMPNDHGACFDNVLQEEEQEFIRDDIMDEEKLANSIFDKIKGLLGKKEETTAEEPVVETNAATVEPVQESTEVVEPTPVVEPAVTPAMEPVVNTTNESSTITLEELKTQIEQLKADNVAYKTTIDNLNNDIETSKKEAQWVSIQNTVPVGWKDAKTEFMADPNAFMTKLVLHNTEHPQTSVKAEGSVVVIDNTDEGYKAEVSKFEQKYHYKFV